MTPEKMMDLAQQYQALTQFRDQLQAALLHLDGKHPTQTMRSGDTSPSAIVEIRTCGGGLISNFEITPDEVRPILQVRLMDTEAEIQRISDAMNVAEKLLA